MLVKVMLGFPRSACRFVASTVQSEIVKGSVVSSVQSEIVKGSFVSSVQSETVKEVSCQPSAVKDSAEIERLCALSSVQFRLQVFKNTVVLMSLMKFRFELFLVM